ncbi:MAG: hypothetical protein ACQESG_02305 [Nanobdellota archaeon]
MRIVLIAITALMLVGCAQTVEEVKSEENIGKEVAVKGQVLHSVKIGDLSGYILEDENNDTIGVASDSLPTEGDTVKARGVLRKNVIFGYYIETE